MRNLIKLLFAAGTLVITSSVFLFYKWLTKYKDVDKKNGNPKKNIANKNIVEEPAIPSEVNTINQLESGIKEEIKIDCRPRTGVSKSKYESTSETTNQSRLERIIAGPCTDVLRDVLLKTISPSDLLNKVQSQINNHRSTNVPTQYNDIKELLNRKNNYSDFDTTLLYFVLRNLCNLKRHSNGWGQDPDSNDRTVSANIDRIRLLKNTHKSHKPKIDILDSDFKTACDEILKSIFDLEMYLGNKTDYQYEVKRLLTISMDPEQRVDLKNDADNIKDTRIAWTEGMTSIYLAQIFSSFNEDFPMDHHSRLFIFNLLKEDFLKELEIDIKSLKDGVVLTKQIFCTTGAIPMHAYVFEVNVNIDGDNFCVDNKGKNTDSFFEMNDNDLAKVILIRSHDIQIVKTKLAVYKEYKKAITSRNILLHHEYEECDEVAKLVAFKRLSLFCDFIESAIKTVKETLCGSVERQNILSIASQETKKSNGKIVRTSEIERKWKKWVDEEIDQIITKNEGPNQDYQFHKTRYQNIEKELTDILRRLQKFRDNIRPTDQMKLIDDWLKGEVIQNSSALKNNKVIVEYIVGHRGDGNTVVKVFLRYDDEMAKELVKQCCKVSRDLTFEFVNIEAEKEKIFQNKKKNKSLPQGASNRKELKQIVQKYTDKMFATYSNVVGVDQDVCEKGHPCIVLYCLDETLMPFGENPLPNSIGGFSCKIKEAIPMLGMCRNCQYPRQNVVMPGCSIGIPSTPISGSVGFLVESNNPMCELKSGFLTSSHVAIANFHELYIDQTLLSMHPLRHETHLIVHPSWEDNDHINNPVGEVVESFIGNFGHHRNGLDIAVVKNNSNSRKGEMEILQVVSDDVLDFNGEIKVMKFGRGSGKTFGYLKHDGLALKIASTDSGRYLTFFNCYAVEDIDHPFFADGDSGSGVYVVKEDESLQPLGIAFARFGPTTAVCKIDYILNTLDLSLVRYTENTEESVEKA